LFKKHEQYDKQYGNGDPVNGNPVNGKSKSLGQVTCVNLSIDKTQVKTDTGSVVISKHHDIPIGISAEIWTKKTGFQNFVYHCDEGHIHVFKVNQYLGDVLKRKDEYHGQH
jgi:hypothetical protein